jgi:hypothetical protein
VTSRTTFALTFQRAKCRRALGYLLLLLISYGATVEAVHSHGPVSPDRPGTAAISDAGQSQSSDKDHSQHRECSMCQFQQQLFDGLVNAAAVGAHAFGGDCVCFHTDSLSFLNFNYAAIGSRAASRLNLTPVAGVTCPH